MAKAEQEIERLENACWYYPGGFQAETNTDLLKRALRAAMRYGMQMAMETAACDPDRGVAISCAIERRMREELGE
jgi:hypothetical protein